MASDDFEPTAFLKTKTTSVKTEPVPGPFKSKPTETKRTLAHAAGLNTTLFYRQKRSFAVATAAALSIVLGVLLFVKNQTVRIEEEIGGRALGIVAQFPEKEAAQWIGRSRSDRSDWQMESQFELQAILKKLLSNRELRYALIVDEKNQSIKGHTSERLIGQPYQPIDGEAALRNRRELVAKQYREGDERIIDISSPIFYGQKEEKKQVGSLHFGLSSENLEKAREREQKTLPFISFLILFAGIASVIVKDRLERRSRTERSEAGKKEPGLPSEEDRLGPYFLERKIASGGMGELFVAIKESGGMKRRVAIKRILPEKAGDEEVISSLVDEASLSSQLHHPNIVTLHDFGNIQGTYFIDMEYVEGVDLSALMKYCREEIRIKHALYIMAEVCKGLDYAHKKTDDFSGAPLSIVHRDISPTNILLSFGGEVKITDFGIAKAAQRVTKHTATGVIKGKLAYLSPEQVTGGEVDHRSDIFSLGLVFYELLVGHKAFVGEKSHQVLMSVARAEIKPIGEVKQDLPDPLKRIVTKSLRENPMQRQQSAGELLEEIEAFLGAYPEFRCRREDLAEFVRGRFSKK